MSAKNVMKLGLAVLFVSGLALAPALAEATCDGTLTLATGDFSTSPGATCGGNYTNTHVSDDSSQCLVETLSGGVSHLTHVWEFESVPAGTQYLIWEGHRPANSDGDNFKFSSAWIDPNPEEGIQYVLFSGAVINSGFEPVGGFKTLMATSDDTYEWYVYLKDTAGGTINNPVYIDYLAICTED